MGGIRKLKFWGESRAEFRYHFDNLMGRGSKPLFGSLLIAFLAAFGLMAILRVVAISVFGLGPVEREGGPLRQVYITFLEITDPGSMTQDVDSGAGVKVFAVLSGMIGLVLLSALIAFTTTALDERLRELRRGRSAVVVSDHTVLLGWNERIADICRELILANESEDEATIVILADVDKEEMDDFLNAEIPERLGTTVVTRRGNPTMIHDLRLVSLATCRSVIVLADCAVTANLDTQHESDISAIKRVLASFATTPEGFEAPIVCEVFRASERAVIEQISPGQLIALDSNDILAKILVQTSRSVGLSAVYEEVLSFDGSEMYVYDNDRWVGTRFGEAAFHFPDGVPLGIVRGDDVILNPSPSEVLVEGDALLALANDDSTLGYEVDAVAQPDLIPIAGGSSEPSPERILIIGWTQKTPTVIREYNDYLTRGSELVVLSRDSADLAPTIAELQTHLDNVVVSMATGNPLDADQLATLDPSGFDQIVLLSQGWNGNVDGGTTDSETIVILLLLRQILERLGGQTQLITEILQSSNSPLVRHIGGHDFIVSNQLVSTIAAQLSESPQLRSVFDNLFSEDGSEFYLKPIEFYCAPGTHTFATYMHLAQQRNEVAIGYRRGSATQNQGVTLVPDKRDAVSLGEGDYLVVLAEDER